MRPAHADVTVGLAMIVKNEAPRLPRLAQTLDGQLDHWTIVDTGSTDDTIKVAYEQFSGVPGEVIEEEWRGYGPSRNVALEAARGSSDFVLTLDADDTVHGSIDRTIAAECDAVEAQYRVGELSWWYTRLIRSSTPCQWRGRAHEYLARTDGRDFTVGQTDGFYVLHRGDGGNRSTKFQREIELLLDDQRDDPDDPRTAFYLARTYDDVGDHAQAARWYRLRTDMEGWDEESWYAQWRLGRSLLALNRVDEGCGLLWRSWGLRPWRAEPLWVLAEHYRLTGQWRLCFDACELARQHCDIGTDQAADPGGDRLFVHHDVYQWRIDYEQSIAAYYVGDHQLGLRLTDRLLARADLPAEIASLVRANRRFYADAPT